MSLKFQIIYKFHLVGVVSVHVHDEPLEIYIQESRSFTILISHFFSSFLFLFFSLVTLSTWVTC